MKFELNNVLKFFSNYFLITITAVQVEIMKNSEKHSTPYAFCGPVNTFLSELRSSMNWKQDSFTSKIAAAIVILSTIIQMSDSRMVPVQNHIVSQDMVVESGEAELDSPAQQVNEISLAVTGTHRTFITRKPDEDNADNTNTSSAFFSSVNEDTTDTQPGAPRSARFADKHPQERLDYSTEQQETYYHQTVASAQAPFQTLIEERENYMNPDNLSGSIIATRRNAVRFKLRNSSELHTDSHNESSKETEDFLRNASHHNMNILHSIVNLRKPFHFHIPIVSRRFATEIHKQNDRQTLQQRIRKMLADETVEYGKTADHDSGKRRNTKPREIDDITEKFFTPFDEVNGEGIPATMNMENRKFSAEMKFGQNFPESTVSDGLKIRNNEYELERSSRNSITTDAFQHMRQERLKNLGNTEMDDLLQQHPKLIPSINRKRSSGNHDSDTVDDEFSSMLFSLDMLHPQQKTSLKREIKSATFSQDLVNSILRHEDDFVKYQKKVNSQATKFGVQPHDVINGVVFGKSMPGDSNETKSVNQRRQEFQTLLTNDIHERKEKLGSETYHSYDAYMKPQRRTKRGLKSWLKRVVLGKEDPTTSTTTTMAPKPRRKNYSDDNGKEGKINNKLKMHVISFDLKGDTEVDKLLPKGLRRSTILKKQQELKRMLMEEEKFEEEYEKSEEKEPNIRKSDEMENEDATESTEYEIKKPKRIKTKSS